ncbi:MAG TPA: bifunctional DNA-formamidopyrimidine glycosylase/DNA-(apurinic or apyrimidinic site) lyase [Rhodocyclaceae bacterium]|jgi:formamidopyrimidine-DNA glycosylase|nr:bifunctional DNA-formamidopyrimidine glycosylase/DNA-(apurinic or apyrimidinic site) lyase [Rhodocyclaceae bacterium]
MPELPEVEVTRLGISPSLTGQRVSAVVVRTPKLRYPIPGELSALLCDKVLQSVTRRAKYLLLDFGHGRLLLHLGMSGSLRLLPTATVPEKHDHIDIVFGKTVLRFRDPRRFGSALWLSGEDSHALLDVLGPEPLSDVFDAKWLHQALKKRGTPIKPTLMDGHLVVGIGNIYASESLFRARINPKTAANKVSLARLERLVPEIKATLTAAIAKGGSSLRDFIHSDGSSGYFQQEYFVYGRDGLPCRVCGAEIKRIVQGQRATFYCPSCQR